MRPIYNNKYKPYLPTTTCLSAALQVIIFSFSDPLAHFTISLGQRLDGREGTQFVRRPWTHLSSPCCHLHRKHIADGVLDLQDSAWFSGISWDISPREVWAEILALAFISCAAQTAVKNFLPKMGLWPSACAPKENSSVVHHYFEDKGQKQTLYPGLQALQILDPNSPLSFFQHHCPLNTQNPSPLASPSLWWALLLKSREGTPTFPAKGWMEPFFQALWAMVFVATTHLCHCDTKAATDDTQMDGHGYVPIKPADGRLGTMDGGADLIQGPEVAGPCSTPSFLLYIFFCLETSYLPSIWSNNF